MTDANKGKVFDLIEAAEECLNCLLDAPEQETCENAERFLVYAKEYADKISETIQSVFERGDVLPD